MSLDEFHRWLVQPVPHYNHSLHNYILRDLLLHSGIDVHIFYSFYCPSFFSGNPFANQLINFNHGQQMMPHIFLIIFPHKTPKFFKGPDNKFSNYHFVIHIVNPP